jgi:hypothetical protein
MASRWFLVSDPRTPVLFGCQRRSVLEVFAGSSPEDAAAEVSMNLVQEYPSETAAEAALDSWARPR